MDINLAALSDILFNKVKHLGRFLGNPREISLDLLCFKQSILTEILLNGLWLNYGNTEYS